MIQVAKLIMVTEQNNNKFYNMFKDGDILKIEYGRVGVTKSYKTYPASKWNSLYNSKIRKQYKDVTHLHTIQELTNFKDITDKDIECIVSRLQGYATSSIQKNYTIDANAVTQAQIDEAQKILNDLLKITNIKQFDNILLDLFQIIPRKMKRVKDYLTDGKQSVTEIITREQATLDTMRGQVSVNTAKKDNVDKTILDAMGLSIEKTTAKDDTIIRKNLGELKDRFKQGWKISNNKTQSRFETFLEKKKNKSTRLFWHGSRNENWWNILDSGLVLRPTNAVISGKMFGYGLYFADKARKSLGYTSLRGSHWARGTSNKGYMALYDVHLGHSLIEKNHASWMYNLTEKILQEKGDYDSLSALGGIDLINNEFIIYNENQCTARYIVELS